MKRVLTLALAALVLASPASAQEDVERSDWSFNTRVWSTNYWTYLLTNVASMAVKGILYVGDTERMDMVDRFVPTADLVFPIGMQKDGFGDNNIYGPYHRAWSTPFKRMGDFAAGGDVSWSPWFVGLYAGCYFKSQEICFQDPQKYLRGYYVQPRAGISLNFGRRYKSFIEAGMFYDFTTGYGGDYAGACRDMLKDGFGLDFAIGYTRRSGHSKFLLQFSMPLHGFLNEDFVAPDGTKIHDGMKRRVGYIMLTRRIMF